MVRRAVLVGCALLLATADGRGQIVRRRFDPEDLDLEERGVLHADLAIGVMRGEQAGRFLVPDFDLDYGLAPNVEIGLDGAWAVEGTPDRLYALDHRAPDNLWLSSKVGLFDAREDRGSDGHPGRAGWAGGVQLGPRVPVAPDARGIGFQALGLLGRVQGRLRLVANGGFLVEPGETPSRGRPTAVLTGLDASVDLDAEGTWSIDADLSYVAFMSPERNQLSTTTGLVWSVTPWLDVSANGLLGFLDGGDRYGAYLGLSPRVPIF